MKIEIDLSDFGFTYDQDGHAEDARTLQEAVVAAAANQLLATSGWAYRDELRTIVHDESRSVIRAKIDEALHGTIQRTTVWGEPTGDPTTLLEIARDELGKFMNGKQVRNGYDRGNSPAANLAELVHNVVGDLIRGELGAEIHAAKRQVVDQLHKEITKAIADALTKR